MSVDPQSRWAQEERERERADERTKEGSSKVKAYSETGLDFRKISMVFRVLSFRKKIIITGFQGMIIILLQTSLQ
jgi:hypothetical protein